MTRPGGAEQWRSRRSADERFGRAGRLWIAALGPGRSGAPPRPRRHPGAAGSRLDPGTDRSPVQEPAAPAADYEPRRPQVRRRRARASAAPRRRSARADETRVDLNRGRRRPDGTGRPAPTAPTAPRRRPAATRRGSGTAARTAGGGSGKRRRSFWRELPVLIVVALVLALLIKSFVDPGVLHPVRLDGEHPRNRRPGADQQDRLPHPADPPRRHRRVRRHRVVGPRRRVGEHEHLQQGGQRARGHRRHQPRLQHLHQARDRRAGRPRGLLQRQGPGHRQRGRAERELLPVPGQPAVRPAVQHHRPAGQALGDGRPPGRLLRLPRAHGRSRRRDDPGERGARPRLRDHLAAEPVGLPQHPRDLRAAAAERVQRRGRRVDRGAGRRDGQRHPDPGGGLRPAARPRLPRRGPGHPAAAHRPPPPEVPPRPPLRPHPQGARPSQPPAERLRPAVRSRERPEPGWRTLLGDGRSLLHAAA